MQTPFASSTSLICLMAWADVGSSGCSPSTPSRPEMARKAGIVLRVFGPAFLVKSSSRDNTRIVWDVAAVGAARFEINTIRAVAPVAARTSAATATMSVLAAFGAVDAIRVAPASRPGGSSRSRPSRSRPSPHRHVSMLAGTRRPHNGHSQT